jgi:hypothetical protein
VEVGSFAWVQEAMETAIKGVLEAKKTAGNITGQAPLLAAYKHGRHVHKAHTHNWISSGTHVAGAA